MRYLPHTTEDIQTMLQSIGVTDIEDLLQSIPTTLRAKALQSPPPHAESDLLKHYQKLTGHDGVPLSFVGAGLYSHHVPAAVDAIVSRGEFLTSYTPYQAEISQGTLQVIFEFQTMVGQLLGLPIANASLYDGASATAEAVLMCLRLQKSKKRILVASSLHPHYHQVVCTHLDGINATISSVPLNDGHLDPDVLATQLSDDVAAVVVQHPNCLGLLEDIPALSRITKNHGAKLITVTPEPTSFGVLQSPGAMGADVAVAEGTGLGILPGFGGPGLGLFAAEADAMRQIPGRICGQATDAQGKQGYVLTLSAREQHIRREKATSNICTNQGLNALALTIHLALLGPHGLHAIAEQSAKRARFLVQQLEQHAIYRCYQGAFYNEIAIDMGDKVEQAISSGIDKGLSAGFDLGRWHKDWAGGLLIAVNETHSRQDIETLVAHLVEVKQ